MHDAAVGAHGHVDAGLLEIAVALCAHVDKSGSLAAANALLLTGDADGAAADADLHEVSAGLGEEAEALGVDDVAGTDADVIAVVGANPLEGALLPLGVTLGRVDAQGVDAGLDEQRHALGVVAGVDASAHHVGLLLVEELVGVGLVAVVVLAEHEVLKVALGVDERQGVELALPDDVVGLGERDGVGGAHKVLGGGHELGDLRGGIHAGDAVIAARHNTEKLALGVAVDGDGHGGVAGLLKKGQDVGQGVVGRQRGVAANKAGLVGLDVANHLSLVLRGLRTVDERHAALSCESNGKLGTRDGLHDGRDHGDVERDARLLAATEARQRGTQADPLRRVFGAAVTRHQQILAKRMCRLRVVVGHSQILS